MRLAGLDVHIADRAGAEPKHTAQRFLLANDLMAEHHYSDVEHLASGGPCAQCARYCAAALPRADLHIAGFPCQPFSMYQKSSRAPESHTLFPAFLKMISVLRVTQPRSVVLENSIGFLTAVVTHDGTEMPGLEYLKHRLGDLYHVEHAILGLQPWATVMRTRTWMFLVHKDTAGPETARLAADMATELEERRIAAGPSTPWDVFLFGKDTAAWRSCCNDMLRRGQGGSRRGREGEKWKAVCDAQRAEWRDAGWGDLGHPLADAAFLGMTATPRQRETLELRLLGECMRRGLDPRRPDCIRLAKGGLAVDVSQSVREVTPAQAPESFAQSQALSPGSSAHSRVTPTKSLCTTFELYHYAEDRCVHPKEVLLAFGWKTAECDGPDFADLPSDALRDLVGESFAAPCAAAAQLCLLFALGTHVPGLWADP